MSTLIAYYSMAGNNKILAQYLQEKYGFDLLEIKEKKNRNTFTILLDMIFKKRKCKLAEHGIDLSKYDNVVLMGPVWMGRVCKPVLTFTLNEADRIGNFGFISVCGGNNKNVLLQDNFYFATKKRPNKILQLAITPFIPEEKRKDVKYVMGYKLNNDDMQKYDAKLEQFFKQA